MEPIPELPIPHRPSSAIDPDGTKVKILPDGLVKLDGVILFRAVMHDGKMHLQFIDHDRMRVRCRGSKFVEIPLDILIKRVEGDKPTDEQQP